jgi:hypothetical protein
MSAEFMLYRGLIAVAVGVGAVLGIAGVYLYQELFPERRRMLLQRDSARLDMTVAEIPNEVDAESRKSLRRRRVRQKSNSKSDATDRDVQSAVGPDDDDDEFFDCSDEINV